MRFLLKYLKKYTAESIIAPLFKLIEATIDLLVPIVVGIIIDRGIVAGDRDFTLLMCALLVGMAFAGLAFSVTAQYFSAKAACGFSAGVRSALFEKIQSMSYAELDTHGTASLITRMTSDVNRLQNGVNLTLRLLLRSPFVVFGAMITAFIRGRGAPAATVSFAVVIPVLLVVVFFILLMGIPLYSKAQSSLDKVTGTLKSDLDGARVVRAFRLETNETEKFSGHVTLLSRFQLAAGRISGLLNPLTYVIINLAIIALIYSGTIEINSGNLTQGELVALYNLMTQILVELIKMANLIITITQALASAKRIGAVMNEKTGLEVLPDEKEVPADAPAVKFTNVTFGYNASARPVLEGIDFEVKKGETVGIVGGTGSGKSTLVSLIPRFYDAADGTVEVFGKDVRSYDPDELRGKIGFAEQHAVVFKGTFRSNITIGKPDACDAEILAAAKTAQFLSVISEKENGLDSDVEQNGRNLSGGQRQRLGVARALLSRPGILILDDCSSALDRATDAELRRALGALDWSPTVFIISQRIESVRGCDRIIVLDAGRTAGIGTHEELYGTCPVYREICDSQKGGESL